MARDRRRALFVNVESAYGTDPSANGSTYLWVPSWKDSLSKLIDKKAPIPTDYYTGRNHRTPPIPGPDGWEFSVSVPLIGLAAAAGDGATPNATNDWLDLFLLHITGTAVVLRAGEGVNAGSGANTLVNDTSNLSLNDLVPVYEAGLAGLSPPRSQWAWVTGVGSAPTYNIAPAWAVNPTTAAIQHGARLYRPNNTGGATLSFVYVEDEHTYTLLGGRVTKAVIRGVAGQPALLEMTIRGDSKTLDAGKSSLPAIGTGPSNSPLMFMANRFTLNDVAYSVPGVEIDLMIRAAELRSGDGANGRSGDEIIDTIPMITVEPERTDTIQNLKRNATLAARLMAQLGAGVGTGGPPPTLINSMCFGAQAATVMDAPVQDENGRLRNGLKIEVNDPGATGVAWQIARA